MAAAVIFIVAASFGIGKIINAGGNYANLIKDLVYKPTPENNRAAEVLEAPSDSPEENDNIAVEQIESDLELESDLEPTPEAASEIILEPTPEPAPTPTPTPEPPPKHCSIQLTYKLGAVDVKLFEMGYSREGINELLAYAEKQWEDALDIDLFNNYQDTPNTVNIVNDPSFKFRDGEDYDYTDITYQQIFSNGTVGLFTLNIHSSVFYYATALGNPRLGNGSDRDFMESALIREIMHGFGHAMGLKNLNTDKARQENAAMSGGKWLVSSYRPTLSQEDKDYAKIFCSVTN